MSILVNGECVDNQLLRNEARVLKEQLRIGMPGADDLALEIRAREWARQNAIDCILLKQRVMQDPAPIPADAITGARAKIELDLRIERLLASITAEAPRPKAKEVAAHYQQYKSSFYRPELVRAAHIVKNVDERSGESEAAEVIHQIELELNRGASFAEVADRRSDCPGQGGDLGFFARGEMVEEFDAVVFALAPGETGPIFRSPFGFHIAKVLEKKPAGIKPLKEVSQEIERLIWEERKRQAVNSFMESLRASADIRRVRASEASSPE